LGVAQHADELGAREAARLLLEEVAELEELRGGDAHHPMMGPVFVAESPPLPWSTDRQN
jgi:hypothetical protein